MNNEALIRDEVLSRISLPCDLEIFDSIGSTNSYAKAKGCGSVPLCVLADCQTAGRGRLGRSFASPGGTGIYLSVAKRLDIDPAASPLITMAAAVAAAEAIEDAACVSCGIKWVNDLYLGGLKVAGILVESVVTGSNALVVIGIGINCFPGSMPEELSGIAGFLSIRPGSFSRSALAGTIIDNILHMPDGKDLSSFLPEYRRRSIVPGREVVLSTFDGRPPLKALALGIADSGALEVRYLEGPLKGETSLVTSGEVSLHLTPSE